MRDVFKGKKTTQIQMVIYSVLTAGEASSPTIRSQDLAVDPSALIACKENGATRNIHGETNAVERRD
jgi:hypothetical protein